MRQREKMKLMVDLNCILSDKSVVLKLENLAWCGVSIYTQKGYYKPQTVLSLIFDLNHSLSEPSLQRPNEILLIVFQCSNK